MKRSNVRSVLSAFESAVYIMAQSIAPTIGIMLLVHLINRWPQLRSPRKQEIGPGSLLKELGSPSKAGLPDLPSSPVAFYPFKPEQRGGYKEEQAH